MSKHHITQNIRPMDPLNIHTLTQRLTQDTHTYTQDTCRNTNVEPPSKSNHLIIKQSIDKHGAGKKRHGIWLICQSAPK